MNINLLASECLCGVVHLGNSSCSLCISTNNVISETYLLLIWDTLESVVLFSQDGKRLGKILCKTGKTRDTTGPIIFANSSLNQKISPERRFVCYLDAKVNDYHKTVPDECSFLLENRFPIKTYNNGLMISRIQKISPWCYLLVGHNIDSDLRLLTNAGLNFSDNLPTFCLMKKTKDILKIPKKNNAGYKKPKLAEVYNWFTKKNYSNPDRDSKITVLALQEIKKRIQLE